MNEARNTKLLVVSPAQDNADRIGAHLRSGGRKIHVQWLQQADALADALEERSADLICIADELDKAQFKTAMDTSRALAPNLPVLIIADSPDLEKSAQLMERGASDIVYLQNLDHLGFVVHRELASSGDKRELADAKNHIANLEKWRDRRFVTDKDALAYIQDGVHIRVNNSYTEVLGYEELTDMSGLPLMDIVAAADRPLVTEKLNKVLKKSAATTEPFKFQALRADGSEISLNMQLSTLENKGEKFVEVLLPHDAPTQAFVAGADASSAGLAGAEGRISLYNALREFSRREPPPGISCLFFVTVDNVNELYQRLGFEASDFVLNDLAAQLLKSTARDDRCYRFTSGEFVLIATREDIDAIKTFGDSLKRQIDDQVFGNEQTSTSLTVSIAALPLGDDPVAQDILPKAWAAAHQASKQEGNKLVVEEEVRAGTRQMNKLWLSRIKEALKNNQFRLAYQSIASLEGDQRQFFDVLLRMLDSKGELTLPGQFIPIAESHGLMPAIDQWVIQQIINLLVKRQREKQESRLFVKIAESTIGAADRLVPWVQERIKQTGIEPEELLLTFNEEHLQGNIRRAQRTIEQVKRIGCGVAINHFGVTSKSSQLLGMLPADYVKLDASFTDSLAGDREDPRLHEALSAAKEKGVKIIAEHVENAHAMAQLWQLGVNYVQGNYVQEPEAEPDAKQVQVPAA